MRKSTRRFSEKVMLIIKLGRNRSGPDAVALASNRRRLRISKNVRMSRPVQEPRQMSLASSPSRPSPRGDADFDLAGLGATLWQKRYTILRPTVIVALLTLGVVLMIPPKYQSEARVLVVGRDNVYLRPDGSGSSVWRSAASLGPRILRRYTASPARQAAPDVRVDADRLRCPQRQSRQSRALRAVPVQQPTRT
jgi:Chain length determinant protein